MSATPVPTTTSNEALSFDIVLKVAERCNLACDYCYYYMQEFSGYKNKAFITQEVMDELPGFLVRSVNDLKLGQLHVVFHGGEPLLLKKSIFDSLCTTIRNTLEGKVKVAFAIQTNGVLIDEEWISLFEKHKFKVGVSIDGSREIHDRRRPDHAGRGSYEATVRGLRALQAAASQGRLNNVGAICVVHPSNESDKLLEHFVRELGIRNPNLNFPRGGWDNPDAVKWNQEVESHRKLVRYTLDQLIYPQFHFVRSISDVLLALRSTQGAEFNDQRKSRRHHIATISSEGDILVDDNMLGLDERFANTGVKIFGKSLRDLLESPTWQMLNDAIDQVPAECQGCEWFRSCRSGELFNRYSKAEGFAKKSVLCDTIKMIHEEVAGFLVKKTRVSVEDLAGRLSQPTTSTAKDTYQALMK
ncbi:arylsulfatase [Cystobacter fuscus]|uniref:Arylsulfatase n=1 Tax=Cystobacter fuscus TaxID=43 RepID=A0A250J6G4_9BACT|nr:radical SAM protein [Cystobacter fuscus]ATB39203.1 arylsulfatase [Cystobacter fuscus]